MNQRAVERAAIGVLVAGFAIGTVTHTLHLVNVGSIVFDDASIWMNVYWTALTALDPLAAGAAGLPPSDRDAFFAMMLDEGVPPPLVSQILLRLLDHPDADRSLPITPISVPAVAGMGSKAL